MTSSLLIKCLLVVYLLIFVVCLKEKNYPKALYWFSASLINVSILLGFK